jgi:NDP-4-keto-2,6-dideoxyhexose 3-C-methyltransferase
MLENINFYDICNEHLEYYSLQVLETLMNMNGLKIVDASLNNVNGGSARVFIKHIDNPSQQTDQLKLLLEKELDLDLFNPQVYIDFYDKIKDLRDRIKNSMLSEIEKGELVLGLGASTKGNMLLQLFGIDNTMLPYISERNPDKVGLKTLGTDIELISEEKARELKPSCMLVLPWYFKDEIVEREQSYIQAGGKLMFPMPYPHIVTKDGEIKI